jgi:hypothetical protein
MGRSLDNVFNARGFGYDGIATSHRVSTDDVWLANGLTIPAGPAGTDGAAIYSRKAFEYPLLMAFGKMPTYDATMTGYLGLENGGNAGNGYCLLVCGAGSDKYYFEVGNRDQIAIKEITSLMPVDCKTVNHAYNIKCSKHQSWLMIDGEVVAVMLHGVRIPSTWSNLAPFAIGSSRSLLPSAWNTLIEIYQDGGNCLFPITRSGNNEFVAQDGPEMPPKIFRLYNENTSTLWTGQSMSAAKTSHPIPVWGYSNATLQCLFAGAGSLAINYLGSDNVFHTLDTVVVTANNPIIRTFDIQTPLLQFVFTPTGTVVCTHAEVNLG